MPCIHIAGTNGKGSTAATLEALLGAQGLRVAKYTSPHLVDFRERIVVDAVPITGDAVVSFVETHTPRVERIGATFFEATTVLAFDHFARAGADVAVIETGLGGRLDSTNVVSPLAATVTTIGIEHTEYLGATLGEIAREKAGIFKPGVPAVIGEPDPAVADDLAAHARAAGAEPVLRLVDRGGPSSIAMSDEGTSFDLARADGRVRRLHTPLVGRHQAANAATALLTLEAMGPRYAMSDAETAAALGRVRAAGRFELRGRWLFDVAHNPDGAVVLARTLEAVRPPRPTAAVFAVLADKDWRGMMDALAPHVDLFVLTIAPTAPASRTWDPAQALAHAGSRGWPAVVERDFARALARADAEGRTVLVTGSFHTVGDAMARLPAALGAG